MPLFFTDISFFLFSKETLSQLIHLQNASKKRMVELKDCEAKIEKAFGYLAKVLLTGLDMPSCPVTLVKAL